MDDNNIDKEYQSLKIPDRQKADKIGDGSLLPDKSIKYSVSPDGGLFYEIEYDACPIKGVGKFVLKSQKIEPQEKDEIRELFYSMRDISRNLRTDYRYNRFFDKAVQHNNALIFYKQGIFMKDFTDDFCGNAELSSYFPNYQMMGYEQLRTYFTWRTRVRNGTVLDTSLSYAFLYIYELLNNIGVENPQDGLDKLMLFWKAFSGFNQTIDKYVIRWLKDYHIYYDLPQPFKEFAEENNLLQDYPQMADASSDFDLFCAVSKYDIRKSAFFTDENKKLITDCWGYVTDKLGEVFLAKGINFENTIFAPTKKMSAWQPFKDTLFYPWLKQPDRRVILSQYEIYVCSHNQWEWNNVIAAESGKRLIGYMMKQMESALRKITKYKFKLSANGSKCSHPMIDELNNCGLSLAKMINAAVLEFYKELTKVVVSVDHNLLDKIRQEALITQEKLIVEEPEEVAIPAQKASDTSARSAEAVLASDVWENLNHALNEMEKKALRIILTDSTQVKRFADNNGIMLEVLIDNINEKAMDFIGDNLLDDELMIYEDYIDNVKEVVV